jgi:hypothetical protein
MNETTTTTTQTLERLERRLDAAALAASQGVPGAGEELHRARQAFEDARRAQANSVDTAARAERELERRLDAEKAREAKMKRERLQGDLDRLLGEQGAQVARIQEHVDALALDLAAFLEGADLIYKTAHALGQRAPDRVQRAARVQSCLQERLASLLPVGRAPEYARGQTLAQILAGGRSVTRG